MSRRFAWPQILNWPISRAHQGLFAEALSQSLAAGVDVSGSVVAAAQANPSRRFRKALLRMGTFCRSGYDLETSLKRTGVPVAKELLAALRVGEDRGRLAELLAAFARRCDPRIHQRLAEAVSRPDEATRFAGALAILLADHPLTIDLVEDAAHLAGADSPSFRRVMRTVVNSMKGGAPFSDALTLSSTFIDPLFCLLVSAPTERSHLRAVLARIAGDPRRPGSD